MFSAGGPDASLEAVAKRAGVGIGTLYRHFPTREALFEAVYRREVEQLGELAEQLKSEADAGRARCGAGCDPMSNSSPPRRACWRRWRSPSMARRNSTAYSFDRLTKAVGALAGPRGRRRRDPRRYQRRKTCCGPSSACATCTTSPAGRPACCGCWMSSSMASVSPPPAPRQQRPAAASPQRRRKLASKPCRAKKANECWAIATRVTLPRWLSR